MEKCTVLTLEYNIPEQIIQVQYLQSEAWTDKFSIWSYEIVKVLQLQRRCSSKV
jgi:hypothetical protein